MFMDFSSGTGPKEWTESLAAMLEGGGVSIKHQYLVRLMD